MDIDRLIQLDMRLVDHFGVEWNDLDNEKREMEEENNRYEDLRWDREGLEGEERGRVPMILRASEQIALGGQ